MFKVKKPNKQLILTNMANETTMMNSNQDWGKTVTEKKYVYKEDNDDYASKGVAGTALGLGIGALGLNLLQNGGLGNLFNLNNNNRQGCGVTCEDRMADMKEYHSEMFQNYKFTRDSIDAVLAKHNADAFALFQGYSNQNMVLQKEIDDLKTKIAINEAIKPYEQKMMYDAIALEAERRAAADCQIVGYTNCTFYPINVADVTVGTATTPKTLFNPLNCLNGCGCGR